ncbi:MAG: hypothetical protein IM662_10100 [Phenylobacterium sp.]|nr:hypothetical protein [Phenylobacterium sp.]
MSRRVSRTAVFLSAAIGSLAIAGAASADPGGTYLITNNATVPLNRTAESFSSSYRKNIPLSIPARSSTTARAEAQYGETVFVGTFMYQRQNASGPGCSFTTVVTYNRATRKYMFTFSSAVQGGPSSPATCSITASRDVNTGRFTAYPVIGGF